MSNILVVGWQVGQPAVHNNWAQIMEEVVKSSLKVKNETIASQNFRHVYFMDETLDIHELCSWCKSGQAN